VRMVAFTALVRQLMSLPSVSAGWGLSLCYGELLSPLDGCGRGVDRGRVRPVDLIDRRIGPGSGEQVDKTTKG
jgi:hypothetical protein